MKPHGCPGQLAGTVSVTQSRRGLGVTVTVLLVNQKCCQDAAMINQKGLHVMLRLCCSNGREAPEEVTRPCWEAVNIANQSCGISQVKVSNVNFYVIPLHDMVG